MDKQTLLKVIKKGSAIRGRQPGDQERNIKGFDEDWDGVAQPSKGEKPGQTDSSGD